MVLKSKAYYLLIGFFLCSSISTNAQNQNKVDSLLIIYEDNKLVGDERMELLRNLAFNETKDLEAALQYSNELIALASEANSQRYLYHGYINKGNTLRMSGELNTALDALFKASEAAKKANLLESEAISYTSIADVYSEIGNANNAEQYYDKGIAILRQLNKTISLASALFNAGDELFNSQKYDKALANFEESGRIFKDEDYLIGTAYTIGNIGMIHAEQGKHQLAEDKINEAISILEGFEDHYAIAEYLTYMSDIYVGQDDWKTALAYADRSLELAKKNGLKKQLSESNLKLAELHEQAGNFPQSYAYYKDHIAYRDSIINLENIESMADQRTNFEVSQKQAQVDLLNQQKRNQRIIIGFTSFLLLSLYWYYRTISKEKKKSERLLLNILPEETAKELKEQGKVTAKKFESVTVLFTDFKGFTHYAENLPPEQLVESVDYYFSKFDEIMEKYGLEKIKTVGDAYMCAGGLHSTENHHAQKMVMAAFDIAEFVKASKDKSSDDATRFDVRIGINTGPVVAGVVGTKKFAYDIWGDAVNIASRMESNSEPGKINVSHDTYSLIKDDFDCEFRGQINVKNRGDMKMYFVNKKKHN